MSRILIAGCGDVGTALGLSLSRAGHEVHGLRRQAGRVPPPLRAVAADLGDPASLAAVPRGVDHAFYLAAAGGGGEPAYRAAYVDGVRNLAAALAGGSPALHRLFFVSSTSVYGQDAGEWVDEDSETRPAGFRGRVLLEAERAAAAGPAPVTVVRFAGIYGPGRTRLAERVRGGAPCQDDPPLFTNRIHRDDCAGLLAHLLGLARPAPLYVGVDDAPAPQCEVMSWLAARLGVPAPPRARAPGAGSGKRCRNARVRASGYRFRHRSYRDGYTAMLDAGDAAGGAGILAPPASD